MEKARCALWTHCGPAAWVLPRSYVSSHFYSFGHIDLLPRIEWRGAEFLDRAQVFRKGKSTVTGLQKPCLAHEALISWFTSLLWGGFFKTRYRNIIISAASTDADEFRSVLQFTVGERWGQRLFTAAADGRPEVSEGWVSSLRRAVWWQAFRRHPLRTVWGWLCFYGCEVKLNLFPPTPWIAVLGPDGSGKSTVINLVRERLGQVGLKTAVFHWRPQFLRPSTPNAGPVTDPHGKPPRNLLTSLVKLLFLFLDWQCGYRLRMARLRAKAQIVIFDRHFLDLLVDPRRYRYGGPTWLARWVAKLIPKPTLLFLLDAPTAVLQERKQEVSAEETERQRVAYREIVQVLVAGRIIDATQPPEKSAEAVIAELFSSTAARGSRR